MYMYMYMYMHMYVYMYMYMYIYTHSNPLLTYSNRAKVLADMGNTFVATRTNLIPSHIRKPLVEPVVDHSVKQSLETQKCEQMFKLNTPRFSPAEEVKVPFLSFYLWSLTRLFICYFVLSSLSTLFSYFCHLL